MRNVADVIRAWVAAANLALQCSFCRFLTHISDLGKTTFSLIQGRHDWALMESQAQATFAAPYLNAEPTGRSFQLRGCGCFMWWMATSDCIGDTSIAKVGIDS